MDPHASVTFSSGQVVNNVCDALLAYQPDFSIKPGIATAEEISDTEIVYTIREGATFSDGSPITATDVVFSLERAASPDSVIAYAFANVGSIDAVSDRQVRVVLIKPDVLFSRAMATVAGVILKKDWVEAAPNSVGTPSGGLVCSGPFVLEEWRSGNSIELRRNENYWDADKRPHAQTVEFQFITDASAMTQALSAGDIDGSYDLPATSIPILRNSDAGQLVFGPSTSGFSMSLARPDGPLSDPDLRNALQLMIDRESLAEVVFNGAASPGFTHLTQGTWPAAERDIYETASKQFEDERTFDMDAAKALVEKSSYSGATVVLAIPAGNDTSSRAAQLIQQQAKQIGIDMSIESLQPLIWLQSGYDPAAREGLDLLLSDSFNSSPSPLEPLFFLFMPGESYNYTQFDDPRVTALLEQARETTDPRASAELVVQAQKIYESASTAIPLLNTYSTMFINSRLTGAVTSVAFWSMPQMAYVGAAG